MRRAVAQAQPAPYDPARPRWCPACGGRMLPTTFGGAAGPELEPCTRVDRGYVHDATPTVEDRERWRRESDEARHWLRHITGGEGSDGE